MDPIRRFRSRTVVLAAQNIDTDQIIPARFLKVTVQSGLGDALFADWRYDEAGRPRPDFPLNRPGAHEARVLVAGHNFGCGSSREHAPWALLGYGFRAVVSTYFADIFRGNALKNGLLPVMVDPAAHARLLGLLAVDPAADVVVDLESLTLTLPDGSATSFPIEPFARHCLLHGLDELGILLGHDEAIAVYEAEAGGLIDTLQRVESS
jgi:3-isopropylmalate/(R)-2-methylmalate dehydratase small subunit